MQIYENFMRKTATCLCALALCQLEKAPPPRLHLQKCGLKLTLAGCAWISFETAVCGPRGWFLWAQGPL